MKIVMETEKIYYADCHCATFRARVLECSETAGGFAVTLDRTAFYPLGGGQALTSKRHTVCAIPCG